MPNCLDCGREVVVGPRCHTCGAYRSFRVIERDAEILRLHNEGKSYREIAVLVGVSKARISQRMRRARER